MVRKFPMEGWFMASLISFRHSHRFFDDFIHFLVYPCFSFLVNSFNVLMELDVKSSMDATEASALHGRVICYFRIRLEDTANRTCLSGFLEQAYARVSKERK